LYHFKSQSVIETGLLTWNIIKTETNPPFGLINYGYAVTLSGIMVLYGGQVESTPECSFQKRTLQTASELWIVNMSDPVLDFMLVNWLDSEPGGYSTIISLDDDLLVVINRNFKNGMKLLDVNRLISCPKIHPKTFLELLLVLLEMGITL
jgi:hypothetical protein